MRAGTVPGSLCELTGREGGSPKIGHSTRLPD